MASGEKEILDRTKAEYGKPGNRELYLASGRLTERGYATYPRIQEAIEFSKEMKAGKVGLAACIGLIQELNQVTRLFEGAGFAVISANCQIGKIPPRDRLPDTAAAEMVGHLWCNPIAQAEIMNRAGTNLNFIIGLCMGHDMLFTRYSKAPVSTLIVKDRILGHNPAAALYASPMKNTLQKLYIRNP
jgi:uncharacterized metal-binding protein